MTDIQDLRAQLGNARGAPAPAEAGSDSVRRSLRAAASRLRRRAVHAALYSVQRTAALPGYRPARAAKRAPRAERVAVAAPQARGPATPARRRKRRRGSWTIVCDERPAARRRRRPVQGGGRGSCTVSSARGRRAFARPVWSARRPPTSSTTSRASNTPTRRSASPRSCRGRARPLNDAMRRRPRC